MINMITRLKGEIQWKRIHTTKTINCEGARMSKNAPQTLTLDESEKLLEYLSFAPGWNKRRPECVRNYTMALMMMDAGLRVGELVQLFIVDLWFQNEPVNTLTVSSVIAKGHHPREVPLTDRLREAIVSMNREWWQDYPQNAGQRAFYCYSPYTGITTRQVRRVISDAGWAALNKKVFLSK